jgi:cysteine sulfinate desulfinase
VAGVIGLSAALEWLAETDIVQAESWSRGWRRWQKKNSKSARVSARSAFRIQACSPLILRAFITATW